MGAPEPRILLRRVHWLLIALRVLLWTVLLLPGALFWRPWEEVVSVWMLVLGLALLAHLRRKSLLRRLDIDERYFDE